MDESGTKLLGNPRISGHCILPQELSSFFLNGYPLTAVSFSMVALAMFLAYCGDGCESHIAIFPMTDFPVKLHEQILPLAPTSGERPIGTLFVLVF